jgi:hypothetical protein
MKRQSIHGALYLAEPACGLSGQWHEADDAMSLEQAGDQAPADVLHP